MPEILEHTLRTDRHATGYLAAGPEDGPVVLFLHGWPELSISWRHQLPVFAGLGFRAIAPDMRGYGRSSTYASTDAYAQEHIVADMLELVDHLGRERAVWVGHDWGAPVVWNIASHHPERCHGVAGALRALPHGGARAGPPGRARGPPQCTPPTSTRTASGTTRRSTATGPPRSRRSSTPTRTAPSRRCSARASPRTWTGPRPRR